MKTVIATSLTVTKQEFSKQGDSSETPILFSDKQEFDNDEDVEAFVECIEIWHLDYPKPNGNFNPFRRVKTPPTEERLFEILDEFHGPADLWVDLVKPANGVQFSHPDSHESGRSPNDDWLN